jgi:hypothetical protein
VDRRRERKNERCRRGPAQRAQELVVHALSLLLPFVVAGPE